ncbi:MAG: 8-amino-7-oxononanoate synthase [Desulfobacterales bacterium]|nr:8-amino-7-oxononanoate synthase [Desulfobacterales bacterium]
MPKEKLSFIKNDLNALEKANQLRNLRDVNPVSEAIIEINGNRLINFSSNDYLGLSKHPLLKQRSIEFIERYGTGSTASRLVCGSYLCFKEIEEKLAILKKTERSLIFNSGFQANTSILASIADRGSLILIDRNIHNSLIQGAILSRGRIERFKHNDIKNLEKHLYQTKKEKYSKIFIIAESVYSMDGDKADIDALIEISKEFKAILIVDDAHGMGIFGEKGMGSALGNDIDLIIGTFGKSCGSFGAYIACSEEMRKYLINKCSGLIYSTALPPSVLGAIDGALEIIPFMENNRKKILENAQFLRNRLNKAGFDTGMSNTNIIPIIVGDSEKVLELSKYLEKNEMFAVPIRPPTVKKGEARIRITICDFHTKEHIETLINFLQKWRNQNN